MMIILFILITLSLDSEWILLGENCCWTLLQGLKGLTCDAIEPNNAVQPHIPYADSTLRLFLPCLELLCTNMLSEQANIPATGSNKDET